jgi:hypothetical protein
VDFSVRSIGQTPLWEQEAIARLNQADAQEDWKEIAERWHPFEPALLPDIFLRQAVRCLNHFDLAALVRTVENVRRTPLAMTLVKSLSATQRLRVAIASDNAFIQFSSAYTTVAKSPRRNDLAPEEAQLLTDLLIKVAGDHSRWTSWMHVFNRYPVRYPALQGPLGAALARAPDTAVGAYTDSIALSLSSDQSRQDVSQCLCTFRASATPERRKMLWTSAHQRWRKWAFDADDPERYMGKIEHSALDYPVVGYALECLDIAGRELALSEIRNDLTVIDDKWYISETQCLASWLRLLSLFQPYAHASNIAESEEDWLSATKIYRPFEPSKNPYVTMKFGGG